MRLRSWCSWLLDRSLLSSLSHLLYPLQLQRLARARADAAPRSRRGPRGALVALVVALGLGAARQVRAEDGAAVAPRGPVVSAMLGLGQWVVFGGGNVAAQAKLGRWVVEYSHGQSLHYNRVALALTEAERDADLEVESPWTTGGGVGYQLTRRLHLLVEAKAHHYLVRDSVGATVEYTTFTVGPGLFYEIYLTRNLFLQPNLRWWPTLGSTHDGAATLMAPDGSAVHPARHDLLPFVNVNLGWTFGEP
ncbi:MAG: hypothetical protein IPI49_10705 [Myxococcales bacterium]|nr:hypothetical protein [Myxococcales bacterium]